MCIYLPCALPSAAEFHTKRKTVNYKMCYVWSLPARYPINSIESAQLEFEFKNTKLDKV